MLSLLGYCPFYTHRLFRGESQFRKERRDEDEDEDENEEKKIERRMNFDVANFHMELEEGTLRPLSSFAFCLSAWLETGLSLTETEPHSRLSKLI